MVSFDGQWLHLPADHGLFEHGNHRVASLSVRPTFGKAICREPMPLDSTVACHSPLLCCIPIPVAFFPHGLIECRELSTLPETYAIDRCAIPPARIGQDHRDRQSAAWPHRGTVPRFRFGQGHR